MLYVYWFRKDLRLIDNRGLFEFIKMVGSENNFLFLYIKNNNSFEYFGKKRISFLIECLAELKNALNSLGIKLKILQGKSPEIFDRLVKEYINVSVYCNKQVEPYCIRRDENIKRITGGSFNAFTDTTLFETGEIKNRNGEQYKVFTPFKNESLSILSENNFKKFKCDLTLLKKENEISLKGFDEYNIESEYKKLEPSGFIKGGRNKGIESLKNFYNNGLDDYKSARDFPALSGTSLLSAHLHFGTVGIREAFRTAFNKLKKTRSEKQKIEVQTWINELLWREFYYNITYHNPQISYESFKKEYDNLRWSYEEGMFRKWCEGNTGYPIVDAGMRQLNKEGWMHNRVRMITAMFLTKDLFIDWRLGEKYFAENLIDLDFSSNNGGWQWSASTGVDSQPYFRIFNPYLQSRKFDAKGNYIKKYLPELETLPEEFLHEPNLMSEMEQKKYGVVIGKDYPHPVVDHKIAKDETLKKFKELKSNGII